MKIGRLLHPKSIRIGVKLEMCRPFGPASGDGLDVALIGGRDMKEMTMTRRARHPDGRETPTLCRKLKQRKIA